MKPTFAFWLLVPALLGSCIYSPRYVDCKVRCAADLSCPFGTTCENGFCRPDDAEGFCTCSPGEERPCGGGQGECSPGVQRCGDSKQWGVCLGEVKPTAELCDGKDNNCNGAIDDDPTDAPLCGRTAGVCAGKVQRCVNGSYVGSCEDSEYGPDFQTVETRCDGRDNDCDGFTDSKPPVHLVNASTAYALAGVDGGYVLAWAELTAGSGSAIKAQSYDGTLVPVGPVHSLGAADAGVTLRSASDGRRAYFSWESTLGYETSAAYIDSLNPTVPVRLFGVTAGDVVGSVSIGADPGGMVAAYPADGGFVLVTYPTDGGATTRQLVVPPTTFGLAGIDGLSLSSAGTTVALSADRYTDAGSTESVDLVYGLDGGRMIEKYVYTRSTLLDTDKGVTSIYSSYCYSIFIFTCNESYVVADFDVWNPAATRATLRTIADYTVYSSAHSSVIPGNWIMTWIQQKDLYVATPIPAALTSRYRRVDLDGGIAVESRIANAGGQLSAIAYSSSLVNGSLEGVLVCPP